MTTAWDGNYFFWLFCFLNHKAEKETRLKRCTESSRENPTSQWSCSASSSTATKDKYLPVSVIIAAVGWPVSQQGGGSCTPFKALSVTPGLVTPFLPLFKAGKRWAATSLSDLCQSLKCNSSSICLQIVATWALLFREDFLNEHVSHLGWHT